MDKRIQNLEIGRALFHFSNFSILYYFHVFVKALIFNIFQYLYFSVIHSLIQAMFLIFTEDQNMDERIKLLESGNELFYE